MVGDGHQPNSRILLISPYKDSLLKVGWPFSILRLLIMAVVSCFMRTTEGFQWIDGSMGISGPYFCISKFPLPSWRDFFELAQVARGRQMEGLWCPTHRPFCPIFCPVELVRPDKSPVGKTEVLPKHFCLWPTSGVLARNFRVLWAKDRLNPSYHDYHDIIC